VIEILLHPVHRVNGGGNLLGDLLAWDDLQILLTVCRIGSFRGAATALKLSVNTIRKRIQRLEDTHGGSLFRRSFDGVSPTAIGTQLIAVAERMSSAADRSVADVLIAPGEVRIGSSEAIGSIWLAPRLTELRKQLGDTTIGLYCEYDLDRDRTREMDLTLQFQKPRNPDLICSRIATIHFMFYASRDYIRLRGMPRSLDDIRNFQLIEQVSPGVRSDYIDALIGSDRPSSSVPLRTNSSLALLIAVLSGAGIAAMPTYVHELTDQLVPLDVSATLRRDLHLVYHSDARDSPAIRTTITWLRAAFDPSTFPWFAGEFIHPNDQPARDRATVPGPLDSVLSKAPWSH